MPARKTHKKRSFSKNLKKGGDCGCNKPHFFTGGVSLGPASLTDFDPNHQYSYALNTHQNDPLAPAAQDATRMDPNPVAPFNPISGGAKRRNKTNKKKTNKSKSKISLKRSNRRRIRGGSSIVGSPLFSAGTLAGVPSGVALITGKELVNPDQPKFNMPMV